jgi:hypothetical protein
MDSAPGRGRLKAAAAPRSVRRFQARLGEALLRVAHERWKRFLEVAVHRPVRGMIDIVLHDPELGTVVATEIHSQIRRFEQQQRWVNEKAGALLDGSDVPLREMSRRPPRVSRLLVLRSTATTRRLAVDLEASVRAAYPTRSAEAYDALVSATAPWPGSALLWATIEGTSVEILREPPRGVMVGR